MIMPFKGMGCRVGWQGQERLNPLRQLARTEAAWHGRSVGIEGGGL